MHSAPILTAALAALAPTEAPPGFDATLDRTEFTGTETEVQIIAYDDAGEVIGTIALWVAPDGSLVLTSDYGDGYAETVVTDGRARTEATLAPEVIAMRADAIFDKLDDGGPDVQEGKFECAGKAILAGAACAKFALSCPFGAYWAACECLPLAMKDFECPDW